MLSSSQNKSGGTTPEPQLLKVTLPDGPVFRCLGESRLLLVLECLGGCAISDLGGGLGGLPGVPSHNLAPQGLLGLGRDR